MSTSKRVTADFILLVVALIWGATFVLVEQAIEFLPPFLFNAIRFLIATATLFVMILLFYPHYFKKIDGRFIAAGVLLGVWLFCGYLFQTVGLVYTTSSKAGFITGLSVVLVPLLSYFLLKHKLSKQTALGITLATAGLYFLSISGVQSINIGDLLVFICAFGFALQIVFTGKYAPHYPALSLAFIQIATVALLSSLGALWNGEWSIVLTNPQLILTPSLLLALLVCSILATVLAYVAQTELQRHTTPTRVALIFTMEPVFAGITDVWWNNRWLSQAELFGCVLILCGMILAEIRLRRKKDRLNVKNGEAGSSSAIRTDKSSLLDLSEPHVEPHTETQQETFLK